jgi:hypothetical protein
MNQLYSFFSKLYIILGYITCLWIIPIPFLIIRPIVKIISNSDFGSWRQIVKCVTLGGWLGAKVSVKGEPIKTGFILPNHRSFMDFAIDPIYSNGCGVGRREAFWCLLPSYWIGYMDSYCLSFTRGQTNRQQLYKACQNHFAISPIDHW